MSTGIRLTFLVFIVMLLFSGGCTGTAERANAAEDQVSATGTVRFIEVEGGCWVIRTDDGGSLSPLPFPPGFREDGLRVAVTYRPRPGMVSTCMTGELVEILSIEKIADPGSS